MIIYNNRYRGPYEYDKFALNILTLHNILENLETIEIKGETADISTLKSMHSEVDEVFAIFTDKDGVSEKAFLLITKERECMNR